MFGVEHVELRLPFALKLLSTHLEGTPGIEKRFLREARIAGSLDDRRLVKVTDFGRVGARPYLVMERVNGVSMRDASADMSIREKVTLVIDLLGGLTAAHEAGLVHRDLKPDNVLVTSDEARVKILDFGIARLDGLEDDIRTAEGAVLGTPRYMAPEQAVGENIDRRADIYAVGVLLFELLCQAPPYEGDSPSELLRCHLLAPIPPLTLPEHPSSLDVYRLQGVVHKAMAKDRADRYETALRMAEALEATLDTAPSSPPSSPSISLAQGVNLTFGSVRQHYLAWATVSLGLFAILVVMSVRAPPQPAEEPSLSPSHRENRADRRPRSGAAPEGEVGPVVVSEDARLPSRASPSVTRTGNTQPPSGAPSNAEAPPKSVSKTPPPQLESPLGALERLSRGEGQALVRIMESLTPDADQRLVATVRTWVAQGDEDRVQRTLKATRAAPPRPGPAPAFLIELVHRSPTFALRRKAYEALERHGWESSLDRLSYLTGQLNRNGTNRCPIRRWYVERLIALQEPRARTTLVNERNRRGGFLGMERVNRCLTAEIDAALASLPTSSPGR